LARISKTGSNLVTSKMLLEDSKEIAETEEKSAKSKLAKEDL